MTDNRLSPDGNEGMEDEKVFVAKMEGRRKKQTSTNRRKLDGKPSNLCLSLTNYSPTLLTFQTNHGLCQKVFFFFGSALSKGLSIRISSRDKNIKTMISN